MDCKYRMFNAPSPETIDRAASLGCNWVIVHSAGIEEGLVDEASGRPRDMFPQYFEDYPKVAEVRHYADACWLEPMRREVTALCERADALGMSAAFHMYEPTLPHLFEQAYPELVGTWQRPVEGGVWTIHSHLDPDNDATWDLVRSKYAELARDFPLMKMIILTTWDGAGSRWCIPVAKMPIHRRLVRMVESAAEGVRSVRDDVTVCFRLWGRNWPAAMYRDAHRMIGEITGRKDAGRFMLPILKPHNDPDVILPKVFAELAPDVPIMYKSTQFDIGDGQPLAAAAGTYPPEREQILEVSYELYHVKPWPWCKVQHLRRGLDAVREFALTGFLALPINMGNNAREARPEEGNLGRMNTWLLEQLLNGDKRTDAELVAAWLEKEFGGPQPDEAVAVLLEADDLADRGAQWGGGVTHRRVFESLHTSKLTWMFPGFIDPEFPYRIAAPTAGTIEGLITMKQRAAEQARRNIERIKAARAATHPRLYEELLASYVPFADAIELDRDWSGYILMQYAIEKGVYAGDRAHLAWMSRFVESFIVNLLRVQKAGTLGDVARMVKFPDPFELPE